MAIFCDGLHKKQKIYFENIIRVKQGNICNIIVGRKVFKKKIRLTRNICRERDLNPHSNKAGRF